MAHKKLVIRIADLVIGANSSMPMSHFNDIGFYDNFLSTDTDRVHCRLHVKISPPPSIPTDILAFSPRGNWQLSNFGTKKLVQVGPPPPEGKGRDNLAIFNPGYTVGEVYQSQATEMFRGFLDQFLIINLLSERNGFLLHSSGVIMEGKGFCFIGQSGAGKSTILRQFRDEVPHRHLLNDDKLALRRQHGRWRVYGTPWHGEFPVASQEGAPLQALFFIKQSKHNYLTKLSTGDALRRLMSQALIPLWDEKASAKVIDAFGSLLTERPAFELGFLPDKSILEFLKKAF